MTATAEAQGIDAQQAIEHAFERFDSFFAEAEVDKVLLEGVEIDEDTDDWLITIGFDAGRRAKRVSYDRLSPGDFEEPMREYRTFRLDGATGAFVTMTNR